MTKVTATPMPFRIGQGYDVHAFDKGEKDHVIIGGVSIPHSAGLLAHSDGDVLIHALCDALLGALALGDIGRHFPDTDPAYKNADSRDLLKRVYSLVKDRDYLVGNIDITVVAQAPKMAPHIDNMCANLASDLETEVGNINVKATTTEKLGFTGRQEGIACYASVLVYHCA